MEPHSSHHRSKKMETESRKRTEALKKDEKKTTEQLSFPPLQETFIPPHPPSVFWQDFRSHIGYLSTADKQIVKNAFIIGEEAHKKLIGNRFQPMQTRIHQNQYEQVFAWLAVCEIRVEMSSAQ